jgi:predicted RND superfamily exporter protein
MERLATFIVEKRKIIFVLYIVAIIFSMVSMGWTTVENDVTKYLPDSTETRLGIEAMNANFAAIATAQVMVSNVTYETALDLSQQMAALEDVAMVTFDATPEHYRDTAALIDQEVQKLLDKAFADAKKLLTDNRELLNEIAEYLLAKETITGEELMAYINADKKQEETAIEE